VLTLIILLLIAVVLSPSKIWNERTASIVNTPLPALLAILAATVLFRVIHILR
jgi:hypothetical protein